MRIDAGWQQMLPLLRSVAKPAAESTQEATGGLANPAAGQSPGGAASVELSGAQLPKQLLALAATLMAGADLLPDDTPTTIKEQVGALVDHAAADSAQFPAGLAPLVAEQRAMPQRLMRLAELVRLAQTLVEDGAAQAPAPNRPADAPNVRSVAPAFAAGNAEKQASPSGATLTPHPTMAATGLEIGSSPQPAKALPTAPLAEPAPGEPAAKTPANALGGAAGFAPDAPDLPADMPSGLKAAASAQEQARPPSFSAPDDNAFAAVGKAPAFGLSLQQFATELQQLEQAVTAGQAAETTADEGWQPDSRTLSGTAALLLQRVAAQNEPLARYVDKALAQLRQAHAERGLPSAQAQEQAWRDLAFAAKLLQHEPAKLFEWSGAIKELANTWARFAQGGAEPASGRELQLSWLVPFVDPEQGKIRPALIQVYRERLDERASVGQREETWLRIATETDNAGLVVAAFHQQGERLNVRVSVEQADGAAFFREQLPDIRLRLQEIWPESGVDVL